MFSTLGGKNNQRTSLGIVAVLSLIAILPHIYKLTLPLPELFSGFLSDDVFYYYKPALNAASGNGFTFDGENYTNGFHPLWMGICVGLGLITHGLHEYLYLALSVNIFFTFLLSVVVFRMAEDKLGFYFSCFLIFTMNWVYRSGVAYFSGLETPVSLLLLCLSIQVLTTLDLKEIRNAFFAGALLGLTILARTEYLLFLPIVAVYIWGKENREMRFWPLILMVLTVFVLIGPYFMHNYMTTGHLEQVSGLVKRLDLSTWKDWSGCSRSNIWYLQAIANSIYDRPLRVNLLLSLFILICLFFKRFRSSIDFIYDQRFILLGVLAGIIIIHHAFNFGPCKFRDWHGAPLMLFFQVLWVGLLKAVWEFLSGVKRKAFAVLMALFLVSALVQAPYHADYFRKNNYHFGCPRRYRHEATMWIRDNLPKDARIGAWNAGYLGYFSGRKVINLDGYINSLEFYQYLSDGRGVGQYILDKDIDYVTDYFWGAPKLDKIRIRDKLRLVKRLGKCESDKHGKPAYIDWYIWKVEN